MIGVMSNTKWAELRGAMLGLGPNSPKFQIKDRGKNDPWSWDGEWYYHFRLPSYEIIEWVDIRAASAEQLEAVGRCLREIHLPGMRTEGGFRIIGWSPIGQPVAYIE